MRLLFVVIFFVILGGSLGIAHSWSELSSVENRMELPAAVRVSDGSANTDFEARRPIDTTGTPIAQIVGEASNDFGVMTRYLAHSHTFVIRNAGDADLLVEKEKVSCGLCVETAFEKAIVRPGEELEIPVLLKARKPGPELNETLELRTNDETHKVIRFDLIAYISEAAGASVSELALGSISTDEGGTASFHIYGFADEPLEIVECKLNDLDKSEYFDFELSDLTPEAVKAAQTHAKFGKEIKVDIKPGLPVGPVEQVFSIVANAGRVVNITVPVTGRVTGDLSLMGGSTFSPATSLLSLGRVISRDGATAKLHVMVKGKHRDDVQVTFGESDPAEYLSATVGERKAIQGGKSYLIPVTVELNKGAPPMNRLGGVDSSVGKIVLQTTHPTATELILYVRFAVE